MTLLKNNQKLIAKTLTEFDQKKSKLDYIILDNSQQSKTIKSSEHLFLELPANQQLKLVDNFSQSSQVFIYLGKNSKLNLERLDRTARSKSTNYFIYLATGAQLQLISWIEAQDQSQQIKIIQNQGSANYCQVVVAGNQKKSRLQIDCILKGKKCLSQVLIKSIAKSSQLNVSGQIDLKQVATLCQAEVQQKSLILDNKSRISNCPLLTVANFDVTASHSATFGQLTGLATDYLQSRGLTLKQARHILMQNFIYENFNWFNQTDFIQSKIKLYL